MRLTLRCDALRHNSALETHCSILFRALYDLNTMEKSDFVYAEARDDISTFVFDEAVASVFSDMLKRSVPGYQSVLGLLGVLAKSKVTLGSHVYDLGCSLGAASHMIQKQLKHSEVTIHAVDNSPAMIEKAQANIDENTQPVINFSCADIREITLRNASLVCLNLTLQFIKPDDRPALVRNIYDALEPNGTLFLFEKICFSNPEQDREMQALYYQFKAANGYSELEISQKRTALENTLIPDTIEQHEQRLNDAGFRSINKIFQCLNFACWVAVK